MEFVGKKLTDGFKSGQLLAKINLLPKNFYTDYAVYIQI